jgi:hypothetical protein
MRTRQPFIIFSTFTPGVTGIFNLNSHEAVRGLLKRSKVPFEECSGRSAGVFGLSFLVADTAYNRELIKEVSESFNQDSILTISGSRDACLEHTDGRVTPLGRWLRWNAADPDAPEDFSDAPSSYIVDSLGRMWCAS